MTQTTDFQAQLQSYEAMMQADATSKAFAPLAEIYRKMGRLDQALQTCQQGLTHHPEYSGARILLARILIDQGNHVEAEKLLIAMIRKMPDNLTAHQVLAHLYQVMRRPQHAEAIAKRLQMLSPEDPIAKQILSAPAPTAAPSQPPVTATMARLYEDQGHWEKALEIYRTLTANQPDLQSEVARLQERIGNKKRVDVLSGLLKTIRQNARTKGAP